MKGVQNGRVLLGDPALGSRIMTREAFEKIWVSHIFFVVHNNREVAQFNVPSHWYVRPAAFLGDAISRDSLAAITLLRPIRRRNSDGRKNDYLVPQSGRLGAEHGLLSLMLAQFATADDFDFSREQAIDLQRLDELRGGFLTDGGLKITLGIERSVFINNELVTTTVLNIPDLAALSARGQRRRNCRAQRQQSYKTAPAIASAKTCCKA